MPKKLQLKNVKVSRLLEIDQEKDLQMGLEVLSGLTGIHREINSPEINRPGLTLAGFYEHFAFERLQVFGNGEVAYLRQLIKENNLDNIRQFFDYDIPACVVTGGQEIPPEIIRISEEREVPILLSPLSSEQFTGLVSTILADLFAPYMIFHGNFSSVHGLGVLIIGKSGIGKSETALGLVERGHKFICDDMVKIKKMRTPKGFELDGEPYVDHGPFIEIRGIGIINVAQYFGEGKTLFREKLTMVIKLVEWDESYNYERLGLEEKFMTVMGIQVPVREIPVSAGRNIPLLVEIAAYREIMRRIGYNSAEELDRKILNFMKKDKEVV